MINIFDSTVTNVAPQAIQTATAAEDLTETVEVEDVQEAQDRQEPTLSTASSASTAPKSRKKMSKKQQFNIELSERILNLADQVDLELAAIGARIKRKLNNDKIDDILDEIKEVTKAFFDRKRRWQEIAAVTVKQAAPCVQPNVVIAVPPPPLVRQPQKVQQDEQQSGGGGGPEVLFDITGMPPMQGYDNLEFVTDPANQNTYMKLN